MGYRYTKIYSSATREQVGELREDCNGLAWTVYLAGRPGIFSGGWSRCEAVAALAKVAGYRPEELEA